LKPFAGEVAESLKAAAARNLPALFVHTTFHLF